MMILKSPLNFAGRLYEAGENVKGQLPLDMIEQLKGKGLFKDSELSGTEQEGSESSQDPQTQDNDNPQVFSPNRSVAELEEYLKGVSEVEEINLLLEQEQASDQTRAGAVKLLEKKLKELQS
ncbi:hypothetical protein ACFQ3J_08805 [Paenibacillus provencensis]|uniref:Uncharacterized protein n=1 Tax=Paenibacillus provencensis TaxID=441151 RepID=A0ABW3PUC0_9BACL|nr:hypothetical protein [Paenibacillus sp. MER 78]MCM3129010.1 hypothetical protein [Paenibacillus sp. MER 78]